ncbi:MAG: formylglycine-generating enzyme family protein [Candidatus Sumerlaeaceae bacterium]|nr:formylglycine-generating enzyme family protein [Candidatus Sumerlaeaceae bacterium]
MVDRGAYSIPVVDNNKVSTHTFITNGFYIHSFEVCNKQWLEFIDYTGHSPPLCDVDLEDSYAYSQIFAWRGRSYAPGTGGLPVVFISVKDAEEFCAWRTRMTGVLHRLPTEDEWKVAAIALDGRKYPWGDRIDGFVRLANGRHIQVGPDPYYAQTDDVTCSGIKYMLGNVEEFTSTIRNGTRIICGSAYDVPVERAWLLKTTPAVPDVGGVYNVGFRYVIPLDDKGNPVPVHSE